MKFWFTKKASKDLYDGKAPYDATVEQVLRVAQEVSATPAEGEREMFDFAKAFQLDAVRPSPSPADMPSAAPVAAPAFEAPAADLTRPKVSRAAREEMERRIASTRAFQLKLNEEREARIRRTMDEVRARLKQSAQPPSVG